MLTFNNPTYSAKSRPLVKAFFVLLFILTAGAGCSTVNESQARRPPKELYDSAIASYYSERYEEAEKTFKTLLDEHPLSPYAVDAQLMMGDVNYAQQEYGDAASYYTNFAALHPTHQKASYAMFQKGMSNFKDILTVDRDQTSTRKALFAFEDLTNSYPGTAYAMKAKELISFLKKRLAERELYVARFYFKGRNYKGALGRLRDILKNYPDAGIMDETLFYIGESYFRLGERQLANDAYSTIITNFPESPFVKEAQEKLKGS